MNICKENQPFFYTPPENFLVCVGGSKNFLYPPEKFLVCVWGGGLKTETGKFHEILTVFLLLHEHLQRKSTFFIPPQKYLVCVGVV